MCEGHYESIQNNLENISNLRREVHDKEMLIDEMHRRLERLEARITHNEGEIENLHQGTRKYY